MTENNFGGEQSSSLSLEVATLKTSRTDITFDITSVVSEIQFYENMARPYITGFIIFTDSERIIERLDIQGAEILELQFKRLSEAINVKPIKQKYIIHRIEKATKTNDFTQVVTLRLIDYNAFKSSLTNVNKVVEGQPYEIIDKLLRENLDRDDLLTTAKFNSVAKTKAIIPHMTPLQAASWITQRSLTENGYPYYFYKTAINDEYIFADLETLLSAKVINEGKPFSDNMAAGSSVTGAREFVIHSVEQAEMDDLHEMIRKGVVGSEQRYYDVTKGDFEVVNFNINNDLLVDVENLNPMQKKPLIDGFLKHEDIEISNYVSKKHSHIFSGQVYDEIKSYDEPNVNADNSNKIKARALKFLLNKSIMKIVVDGDEFINGNENYGIGNNVRILVRSKEESQDPNTIDTKQSGDYLIVAANYVIKNSSSNKSECILLCAKVTNYQSDKYDALGGVV